MTDKSGIEEVFELFGKATTGLAVLMAVLIVIPLTLWYAWKSPNSLADQILVTLLCVSFGWGWVSLVRCYQSLRKLGLDGEGRLRLFSGSRPEDPDELHAWQLGRECMYAVLAVLFCIFAIPAACWLSDK